MTRSEAQMTALWAMHAHVIAVQGEKRAINHSPRLDISSPLANCGKTTLCEYIAILTGTTILSNVSISFFFRWIEEHGPAVMILDELDTFLAEDNKKAIGILNSGYSRKGAHVGLTEKTAEGFKPTQFSTWATVVFGHIGELPATAALKSRCLPVRLQRKAKGEKVESLDLPGVRESYEALRLRAIQWAQEIVDQLCDADPKIPDCLFNRNRDSWRPLIAIAEAAGGHWPETARAIAEKISGEEEDPNEGMMLLKDIQQIFAERAKDSLISTPDLVSAESLITELCKDDARPWRYYKDQDGGITTKQLAGLLKVFDIHSTRKRINGNQCRRYERKMFDGAFARYLIEEEAKGTSSPDHPSHPSHFKQANDLRAAHASHPAVTCPVTDSVTDAVLGGAA